MYKLLLAEEETFERVALVEFIDWTSLGVELAGSAESAEEAVNLALMTHFDIFLTDVRLPGAPGHELARMLLQNRPRLKIIISGNFSEYDDAMRNEEMRACSFISKPIDMGELRAVISRVVRELDGERELAKSGERLKQLVQNNMSLIRRHFFERLVTGSLSDAEILKSLDYFGMGAMQGRFVMLLVEIDGFDRQSIGLNWEGLQMMLEAVKEAVLNLKLDGLLDVFYIDRGRFGALMCISSIEQKNEMRHVLSAAERIRGESALCCGGSITVASGCTVSRIRDLKQSYKSASAALASKTVFGNGQVISYTEAALPASETGQFDMNAIEDALMLSVETANALEARNQVDKLMNAAKRGNWDERRVCAACLRLLSKLLLLLHELNEPDGPVFEDGAVWGNLLACATISDMRGIMNKCATAAASQLGERRAAADRRVVERILDYIASRFGGSITAADIAGELACSPNYVGSVFKREIGKPLPDYVRDVRLEKACELLNNPSNRIGEVAIKVGYPNVSYFCALFKKKYGINPGEYKEKT